MTRRLPVKGDVGTVGCQTGKERRRGKRWEGFVKATISSWMVAGSLRRALMKCETPAGGCKVS